jgi:hypothetical protein
MSSRIYIKKYEASEIKIDISLINRMREEEE